MVKTQAKELVKEVFEQPFIKANYIRFIRELLNTYQEEGATFICSGNLIPDNFDNTISSYERIGKYSDGENEIDLLIVNLKKTTTLDKARSTQRNFIARYLNGGRGGKQKDAALVAFVSPDQSDWRFSLVKMEYTFEENKGGKVKVKEEYTPAKRWSFLVGANENSHTAQSQFLNVLEDESNITLKQLEEAFNIEKVTKEFFEKYRDLFLQVHDTVANCVNSDPVIKKDFEEKSVNLVDFSKKLMGQIVFLYFLQKKGWFGVKRDDEWGSGSKRFLRVLFSEQIVAYNNFFNDVLEPLFYDALARDRSDIDHWNDHFKCKIPFLNGGLFDPISGYAWEKTDILLPNELFSNSLRDGKTGDIGTGILDVFDRYNFTVKEDEPLDKEVAVDPEMLGKVFENLLEVKDRKSKGTYYTPREIVHYMCEQSLINYLATELDGVVPKDDLEKLVKFGEYVAENDATYKAKSSVNPDYSGKYQQVLPESIGRNAKAIDKKLADIKVCDPAIGSGAFPVGMMNEIVRARRTLNAFLCDNGKLSCPLRTNYDFKFECIQNSLYGVDLDPGSVEIAKLRLWLSLIVDEEDIHSIKPLPNLDYKIMQGNSLLEEYEGVKLFDETILKAEDFNKSERVKRLKNEQAEVQKEYFKVMSDAKPDKRMKTELDQKLKNIAQELKALTKQEANTTSLISLFEQRSEAKKKSEELMALHKAFFEATNKKIKNEMKEKIEMLEWDLIETTLKEHGKLSELTKLAEFKRTNTRPFFLWKLHFADVFRSNGGFDVVIANPPYDVYEGHRRGEIEEIRRYALYEKATGGKLNAYKLFLAKSVELQKNNGILCEIFQNSFLADGSASKIRRHFLLNQVIYKIDSFPERDNVSLRVFEGVKMSVCILISRNVTLENYQFVLNIWKDKHMNHGSSILLSNNDVLTIDRDNATIPLIDQNDFLLLKKISKIQRLKEYAKCYEGEINLTFHKKFLRKEKNGCRPMIKGAAVQRWFIKEKMSQGETECLDFENYIKENTGKKSQHFKLSRLVMQGITGVDEKLRLKMTILKPGVFCGNSVNYILISDVEILDKYLLALMNSKLLNWYFKIFSTNSNVNGYEVDNLPIIKAPTNIQAKLADLVDKILSQAQTHDYVENATMHARVRDCEDRINQYVYQLYGLTPDEINIVEIR